MKIDMTQNEIETAIQFALQKRGVVVDKIELRSREKWGPGSEREVTAEIEAHLVGDGSRYHPCESEPPF